MKRRQAIIDGYLAATGSNTFDAGGFVDWLAGQPDHEAFPWFFGKSDGEAAREYRINLARQMVSGLRITAAVASDASQPTVVSVTTREYPAMVSPVLGRQSGGGYVAFHPSDPAMVDELRRQGAQALITWLVRFGGVAKLGGIDVSPIEEIAAQMKSSVADAA